ncbi:MAG: hypothetical protein KDD55_00620 [Bdellovibrionales bacterium]|nr:hypothetical protein [Bdellovibrionales bacterium]
MRYTSFFFIQCFMVTLTACVAVGDRPTVSAQKPPHSINSFEDCVAAGYPIMRSLPAKCKTADGRTFIDQKVYSPSKKSRQAGCKNLCGNGVCDQIVCAALDCPCPEDPHSCPADCTTSLDW